MTYSLTLTKAERAAIDWIGGRYRHGSELYRLLWVECTQTPEVPGWDDPRDLTFTIPEHVAWEVAEIVDEGLDCFSDELASKFQALRNSIV